MPSVKVADCLCYGTTDFDVSYCPMHKAAPLLLKYLEEAIAWAESMDDGEGDGHIVKDWVHAVKKAKGE